MSVVTASLSADFGVTDNFAFRLSNQLEWLSLLEAR
jgi:hypothetical protein